MIVEVEARCYAATCSVLGRVEEHSLQQVNLAEEGGEAGGGVRCGKGIGEDLWEEWERHPARLAASSFDPSSLVPRYVRQILTLPARRPRRRRGTIDKSAIYPHTSK